MSLPRRRKTHKEYVRELKEKGIQAEVLEPYQGALTKITHLWKACGHVTEIAPSDVLRGHGCNNCAKEQSIERIVKVNTKGSAKGATGRAKWREKQRLKALQELDQRVVEVHGNAVRRDPQTPYINSYTKISWICDQGHQWEARPDHIKYGTGCPECATSRLKGETFTREVLEEYGIEFQSQKKFADLKRVRNLSYDFFIPSMDILIECQGKQHYKPVDFYGGVENFADQQERDQLKREYAWENGYYLLEISYKDYRKDRIKAILEDAGVLQKQPA